MSNSTEERELYTWFSLPVEFVFCGKYLSHKTRKSSFQKLIKTDKKSKKVAHFLKKPLKT